MDNSTTGIISPDSRCAVIGYGSWATAIAKILTVNEDKLIWFVPRENVRTSLSAKGTNPRYLSNVRFDPSRIEVTDELDHAVKSADVIILAVPSAFVEKTLEPLTCPLNDKFVVSAVKGIIPGSGTVSEFINGRYGVPYSRIGVVSGPCHSEEVALERLSYLTLAGKEHSSVEVLCGKFAADFIRTIPSTDIYGAEYASVLKNIYAVCAGIAAGIGYGDNFLSVLVANAAREMDRFLAGSYPCRRDTHDSLYLGDLLVTCYSRFSRNREFGMMVGKGYSIRNAQSEMNMVAEGYYASEGIARINRGRIDMPIADTVHRVLYEGAPPAQEMRKLTYLLK